MPVIDLGSVVGPQGPQGATGATGAQGIQGNPGPNQVTDQTSTNLNGVLFGNQSRVTVKPIDSNPTADSTNLVSSGGTDKAIKGRVPVYGLGKNLLDNWDFLNPVNQRGATSGAEGYSIDRWLVSYGSGGVSWSLTSNGLTFQPTNASSYGYICQVIGNEILSALTGKKISVYVLTSDGDVIGGVVTYTSDVLIYDATYDGHRVRIRFAGSDFRIESYASALTVCAVKLELGSEQTLCHNEGTAESPVWVLNEIPDYGEELRKCQRYYFSYQIPANQAVAFPGIRGDLTAGTNVGVQLDLPVVMAKLPTIDGVAHSIRGNGSNWNTGLSVTSTPLGMYANHIAVEILASGASFPALTSGYAVLFSRLNLSAEL